MVFFLLFLFGLFSFIFDSLTLLFLFSFFFIYFTLGWGGFWFCGIFFMDGVSYFLIFLTSLIFVCCAFSSSLDLWGGNSFGYFCFFLGSIFFFLFLSFCCLNLLSFYVFFELSFVCMYIFLLGWGTSPERLSASFYMVFYTLVVSLPFLIFLVLSGFNWPLIFFFGQGGSFYWVLFFLVFMVKLPVYGVHLWLPKAHVEAPVSGSMVLAGVLLKLGVYGSLRFSPFFLCYLQSLKGYFFSFGLIGGLISCFLCLRQSDLKSFIAYSSVCHMGFGWAGLYSGNNAGFIGGVFMSISHGLCSSCLFYILYVFYERYHTRSGIILKGVGYLSPLGMLFWFIFCAFNMGVPPSFSFFSEVFLLVGVSSLTLSSFWFMGLLLFMAGLYGIYLFVVSCHSVPFFSGFPFFLGVREFLLFFSHFFYLLFFIFVLDYFFI